jgi:hypothetical protein
MTNLSEQIQEAPAPVVGPRSIRDIIAELSKPLAARHLKNSQAGRNRTHLH